MGPHLETPRIPPTDWVDYSRVAPLRPAPPLRLVSLTEDEEPAEEGARHAAANRLSRPSPHSL
jgi:hypothetical protein